MITDYIRYAISNMLHRRMRSWLTLIGILIGIAAIVALISLGQGLKFAVTSQFEALGTDTIILMPGGGLGIPGTGAEAAKLTEREFNIVERTAGVDAAAEMQFGTGKLEFNDKNIFTSIVGIDLDPKKLQMLGNMTNFKAIDGRMLKPGDNKKAQIGYLLATDDVYLGKTLRVGNKIIVEGQEFDIIGVTDQVGNPSDDTQIIISIEDSNKIFNKNNRYDAIYARVADGAQINGIVEQIKREIRKLRSEKEGEEDFSIQTTQELMASFSSILNIITAVLIGIAGISLIVGGIGIMNSMYTSVLERTNEIGIMKAIGAKNSDILMIFILEAGLIGLVGGIIGIVIGIGLGSIAAAIAAAALKTTLIQAYFPWYLLVGALAFSIIVGIASGVLPALQASKLKPVDALRYE